MHRQQLLDQWVARLRAFLDIDADRVGVIRGGRKRPTGFIDVATVQSLVRKGEVSDLVADYGHLVVDECHHLSAVSFEAVARAAKAKYVLGLSATVTRKDGHHPIIFMQCGPIRYRVDARKQAAARPFSHRVVVKKTAFRAERQKPDAPGSIQELYGLLARDMARNDMIFDDILSALEAGRSPVVITERKDHLQAIAERLTKFAKNVIVLKGGMGAKQRHQATAAWRPCRTARSASSWRPAATSVRASTMHASIRCFSRCPYPGAGPSHSMRAGFTGYTRPSGRS